MSFLRKLRKQQTPPSAEVSVIRCDTHGEVPYEDDIVCEGCGRLYNFKQKPPKDCACGRRLLCYEDPNRDDWSARIVCPSCARSLREQQAAGSGPS